MPSTNTATVFSPTGVSLHSSSPTAPTAPPAGGRWREAPEGGHRESEGGHRESHGYTVATHGRNPAIGRWQTQFHDGTNRARCELCPRRCVLCPGQRGFCFVRSNHDGLIVSDTYGRSSGFAVDPVEKKPLNHFHPGSSVLSFGTAGCNSGCRFCQNWDIAKARSFERLGVEASPEKIAQVASDRGIDSVAFTYNDPIVFAEYAIDTAEACRALGIHPIAVTAGYMSAEAWPDFYAAMDAANIDLKGFTEEFYWKVTGTHLADVLETIDYATNEARTPEGELVWVELTTLLIPGLNDDDAQLHAECTWIREHLGPDVPLHFSAFHPSYRMMDVPPTPHETLTHARDIALEEGLNYVYTGNVHDREGDTTYCPNPECRAKLVERDWYRIIANCISVGRDDDGRCPSCGTVVAGRWWEIDSRIVVCKNHHPWSEERGLLE